MRRRRVCDCYLYIFSIFILYERSNLNCCRNRLISFCENWLCGYLAYSNKFIQKTTTCQSIWVKSCSFFASTCTLYVWYCGVWNLVFQSIFLLDYKFFIFHESMYMAGHKIVENQDFKTWIKIFSPSWGPFYSPQIWNYGKHKPLFTFFCLSFCEQFSNFMPWLMDIIVDCYTEKNSCICIFWLLFDNRFCQKLFRLNYLVHLNSKKLIT